MKSFAFPLIPFTVFFAIGCIANAYLQPGKPTLYGLAIFSFIILAIVLILKKTYYKTQLHYGLVTLLIAFSLGQLTHYHHSDLTKPYHYTQYTFQHRNCIRGIVNENIKPNSKHSKHIVSLLSINNKKVKGDILLLNPLKSHQALAPGNEVIIYSNLIEIPKNTNPNSFDYRQYLARQNIFHEVFLTEDTFKITKTHSTFKYYLYKLRTNLIDSFKPLNWDTNTTVIINALLFGQKQFLDNETISNYSKAGVIHILAISGLHVGMLFLILNFIFSPIRKLKNGKLLFLIITLLSLWGFAQLTGMSASVTRAVLMFSLFSIGQYLNKAQNIYNTIAISALLLVLYNPNYLFEIGFQMSYAAVLSIVAFTPIFQKFYIPKNKIMRYIVNLNYVSIAAQIGVLPLAILYFNQFSMQFLIANIVIIPTATLVLIIGLMLIPFNYIFLPLSKVFGTALHNIIHLMNSYIKWVANWDTMIITNIFYTTTLCIISYIILLLFLKTLHHFKPKWIITLLIGIVSLQLTYLITKKEHIKTTEFIVFNSKESLTAVKQESKISFHTTDSSSNNYSITAYQKLRFIKTLDIQELKNTYVFQHQKILIIDSTATLPSNQKADIIVLTKNPKINLRRLIQNLNPKQIVADRSNKNFNINLWKATCRKEKIPFHATAEKGFYSLKP